MFAFKHDAPTTPALIKEVTEVHDKVRSTHELAEALAASFPFEVQGRFYRSPFTGRATDIIMRPTKAPAKAEIPAGWRYLKTRDAMEPLRGTAGDAAREALAAIQYEGDQVRDVLHRSGMPEHFTKPGPGFSTYTVQPTYFEHGGVFYSLVNVPVLSDGFAEERFRTFSGDWVECPVSEYYAAYEAVRAEEQS